MDLESKIKELQKITEQIESPNLSIDESLSLYEKGASLAKECLSSINEIKGKINIIKQNLESFQEESFE